MKVRANGCSAFISHCPTGQFNRDSDQPKEVVAEESGQLEIEVHKNASADNPAMHVIREDNDVVKRTTELEKKQSGSSHGDTRANTDAEGKGHENAGHGTGGKNVDPEIGDKRPQSDLEVVGGEEQDAKKARIEEAGQDKPGKKKQQAKTDAKVKTQAAAETTTKKRGRPRKSTGTKKKAVGEREQEPETAKAVN